MTTWGTKSFSQWIILCGVS